MRRTVRTYLRQFYRKCCFKFTFVLLILTLIVIVLHKQSDLKIAEYFHSEPESFFDGTPRNVKRIKIDWHDYKKMAEDANREGLGENGKIAKLDSSFNRTYVDEVISQNGYDGVLSDQISVNRSLPDIRHLECQDMKYLAELPSFSVIVVFFDEHFSVVMRTVHSVINRSPEKLLKEVVIVDDGSGKGYTF